MVVVELVADPHCPICKRPGRARIVEADFSDGITPAAIAGAMRDTGWALTAANVTEHMTLHVAGRAKSKATRRANAALTLRERLMDEVDRRVDRAEQDAARATEECSRGEHDVEDHARYRQHGPRVHEVSEFFDILAKDIQPALGTALKAEAIEVKRNDSAVKRKIDLFGLLVGGKDGGLAPAGLIGDGAIEGTFEEAE